MSSVRQQIVDAVEARLKTIRRFVAVALCTGRIYTYQTNIGTVVEADRTTPLGTNENQAVIIKDMAAPKNDEDVPIGYHRHLLKVDISVLSQDNTPVNDVRKMLADISACCGIDPSWGGLAENTQLINDALERDTSGRAVAAAVISLIIEYDTPLWEV